MERSLRQTLIISRGEVSGLWESPVCLVIWFVLAIVLIVPLIRRFFRAKALTS